MKDQKWFEDMELRIPHGEVRTRFAPSPTGYMHVGNLRTALYTYLIARHAGGKFILRIEDTDQGRYVEGAVDVIYSTMRACGLTHDEGPDVGGPSGAGSIRNMPSCSSRAAMPTAASAIRTTLPKKMFPTARSSTNMTAAARV